MDLGFNLAPSNRDLKDPTSRQNFGDTSGLLCNNDPILRLTLFPGAQIFSGAHPSRPFPLSSLHDPLQSCCLRHISTVSSDLHYSVVPKLKFNSPDDPWT